MKYNFKIREKEANWNDETGEFFIEDKLVNLSSLTQTDVAYLNKLIRDTIPKGDYLKLNLGCGHRPDVYSINLDYDPTCFPDVIRDISEGLPFDSDKFNEVYSSHVIEHVKDVFFYMYEIWRVTKNKGKVMIICPNGTNLNASIQPDHVRYVNWSYFDRWRPEHISVQTELKQTRGAFFNIVSRELINEERELKFVLEVVKFEEKEKEEKKNE